MLLHHSQSQEGRAHTEAADGEKLALHPGNVKSDKNTKACQDNATRQFSTLYTCKGLNSPYGFCPEFNCKKEKDEKYKKDNMNLNLIKLIYNKNSTRMPPIKIIFIMKESLVSQNL